VWLLNTNGDLLTQPEQLTWTVCTMTANFAICFLGWWRCFANNYLHWAAGTTWLLLIAQGNGTTTAQRALHLSLIHSLILISFIIYTFVFLIPLSSVHFSFFPILSVSSLLVSVLFFPFSLPSPYHCP
jgi:cytochrome bd-type quinol oxidase subunit 2